MRFVFKRDEEGVESIHAYGERFAFCDGPSTWCLCGEPPTCVSVDDISDAIRRAEISGFWAKPYQFDQKFDRTIEATIVGGVRVSECIVEVPSC